MDTKHLLLTIYFLCDFAKQKDKQKTFLTQPSASCRRQQWSRTQRRTPASSSGNSWCRSFWWFWTKPHSQASSARKWTSRRRADLQQTSIKPTVFIKTLDQVSLDPIARPDIVLDWSCPSCCVSLSVLTEKQILVHLRVFDLNWPVTGLETWASSHLLHPNTSWPRQDTDSSCLCPGLSQCLNSVCVHAPSVSTLVT